MRLLIIDSSGTKNVDRTDFDVPDRSLELELLRQGVEKILGGFGGNTIRREIGEIVRSIYENTAVEWLLACASTLRATHPNSDKEPSQVLGLPEGTYRRLLHAAKHSERINRLMVTL